VSAPPPRLGFPDLGDGLGLREAHYGHLLETAPELWGVDWFEIITENFLDERGLSAHVLERVSAHRPVVMHGVSLSIGSTDRLDLDYLGKVRALAEKTCPAWVSDHLCWTGVNGRVSHDLLPMPLNQASLAHVADRVRAVQDELGRPLVLENPSSYLEFRASDIPEWEFLGMLAEETGCGLLLDVNNVFVSSYNHGFDPTVYINALPARHIVQVHVAGPRRYRTHLLDTHDRPVPDEVWPLYALAQQRTAGVATLLEWDARIPPFPDLVAELGKAREVRAAAGVPQGVREAPGPSAVAGISGTVNAGDGAGSGRRSCRRPGAPRDGAPSMAGAGPGAVVATAGLTHDGPPVRELAELEQWMLESISRGAEAPRPAVGPDDVLKESAKRTAPFSLDIYARGYVVRLVQCLQAEFPALKAFVGDQAFGLFAHGYISEKPPTSPSLMDLGAGFADYLEEARPRPVGPPDAPDAIPAAIARLERARADAQHAGGVEDDPDYRQVDLLDLIRPTELQLHTPASLQLLRAPFALTGTLIATGRGDVPCTPANRPTCYAVARTHFRVGVHEISAWQYAFLNACSDGMVGCAAALARAAAVVGGDASELWAELLAWLPAAVDAGMVIASNAGSVRNPTSGRGIADGPASRVIALRPGR
jgi:uncharacterized protein